MDQTKITVIQRPCVVDLKDTLVIWESGLKIDLNASFEVFKGKGDLLIDAYRHDYEKARHKIEALQDIEVISPTECRLFLEEFYKIYKEYYDREVNKT